MNVDREIPSRLESLVLSTSESLRAARSRMNRVLRMIGQGGASAEASEDGWRRAI